MSTETSTGQPAPVRPAVPHTARNAISLSPRARRVIRRVAHFVNPLVLRIAGRRWMPIVGVIHHRGRRTGRAYDTPVGMRPLGDGFAIPRTFGPYSAWYQNVAAAGWCTVKWGGADHTVLRPEVVAAATAMPAFPHYERLALRLLGIDEFLLLHRAPTNWHQPPDQP